MTVIIKDKPKILIPFKNLWDIADYTEQWIELAGHVEFVKYRMHNKPEFQAYLAQSDIQGFWITEEFFQVLGNPADYWDFYPATLRVVLVPWVGCDFIDGKRLKEEKNVLLCNIGPNAATNVADLAMHLLLSAFRMTSCWEYVFRFLESGNINECKKYIGGDKLEKSITSWSDGIAKYDCEKPIHPKLEELDEPLNLARKYTINEKLMDSPTNKNVLILGFGSIGQTIGRRLKFGLDMNVYYYKRSGRVPFELLNYEAQYCASLDDPNMWSVADAIILALPGTPNTDNLINKKTLEMCKNGVRIINVGRGTCIDEDALIDALNSKKVNSCGLDVFKDENVPIKKELLQRWDVTIMPHIGSAVADIVKRQSIITLANIKNIFLEGGEGIYTIN